MEPNNSAVTIVNGYKIPNDNLLPMVSPVKVLIPSSSSCSLALPPLKSLIRISNSYFNEADYYLNSKNHQNQNQKIILPPLNIKPAIGNNNTNKFNPVFNLDFQQRSLDYTSGIPPLLSSSPVSASSPLYFSSPSNSPFNSPSNSPPYSASYSSSQDSETKKAKKSSRKRKQCPICNKFFLNLTTHKSRHLAEELRPYICENCHRGFSRQNDLLRHSKKHLKDNIDINNLINSPNNSNNILLNNNIITDKNCLNNGIFICPFADLNNINHNNSHAHSHSHDHDHDISSSDEENVFKIHNEQVCHPTGIFSRCDTFKNHLKALHFQYPIGTKKKDRKFVSGYCKNCGLSVLNVDLWLNQHIMNNKCPGIINKL
ncbi:uncharacterized protein ASCRUDRAFT_73325 [Ascoidea rubescens DSM 1968]|uniref:C2H2-type domain-containing protein n=1 Tax=Ascoidea rubescens DSM 1968 TaxID=1344418 RepID=A0A1D2VPF8_9ASCO|nr:hypothetical protein ASCRUDRAFT_73325 [Ascoidea rubescens DSM 1968]ODV63479.1 hypothetical protein ASCRUDRAFT_73325 [Ascoidea rubescens DSM 1968]